MNANDPAYFLGVSPADMARAGVVWSMTSEHPDIRRMHESLECLIAKLKQHGDPLELLKALRVNILLTGETGTGKELVARAFRQRLVKEKILDGDDNSFGAVNCPCLPDDLLEIELFGAVKGSYTDRKATAMGLVPRLARYRSIDPPTKTKTTTAEQLRVRPPIRASALLFLDEIGAASPVVQAKLLRLIERREFTPLGAEGRTYEAPHLIVFAATNQLGPAATHVNATFTVGEFRTDLYFRLCDTFHFHLPNLAERKHEITLIAEEFYQYYYRLFFDKDATPHLPPKLEAVLLGYNWPGNGRQLHGVIRRAMIAWSGQDEDELIEIMRHQESLGPAGGPSSPSVRQRPIPGE